LMGRRSSASRSDTSVPSLSTTCQGGVCMRGKGNTVWADAGSKQGEGEREVRWRHGGVPVPYGAATTSTSDGGVVVTGVCSTCFNCAASFPLPHGALHARSRTSKETGPSTRALEVPCSETALSGCNASLLRPAAARFSRGGTRVGAGAGAAPPAPHTPLEVRTALAPRAATVWAPEIAEPLAVELSGP
jgi:hypothetical protein